MLYDLMHLLFVAFMNSVFHGNFTSKTLFVAIFDLYFNLYITDLAMNIMNIVCLKAIQMSPKWEFILQKYEF